MAWFGRSFPSPIAGTYLPFGLPGSGLIVAVIALTLSLPHRQSDRRTLVDLVKGSGRMPVVRAIYRGLKQVFETLFPVPVRASAGWPGRISLAGHVVDRADLTIAERGDRGQSAGPGRHISVFLPCAPNPTTAFSSTYQEQDHRNRDERRGCRDPDHVRRRVQPGSDPQKKIAALAETANAAARPMRNAEAGAGEGG